jgi:hypothetical protein
MPKNLIVDTPFSRGEHDKVDLIDRVPDSVLVILQEVAEEYARASIGNTPMHSLHEGYAVILEEMDELKTEVWKNPRKHPDRNALARKEAIQVAAMALRLLHDVL